MGPLERWACAWNSEDVRTGVFTEDSARTLDSLAQDVSFWASALADAWQQDQQKDKWRVHVVWCQSELDEALAALRDATGQG